MSWIETVLLYYYTKKGLLLAGENDTVWDYSQFTSSDPEVQLGSLYT